MNAAEAYGAAYPKVSLERGGKSAARLLAQENIQAEIAAMRQRGEEEDRHPDLEAALNPEPGQTQPQSRIETVASGTPPESESRVESAPMACGSEFSKASALASTDDRPEPASPQAKPLPVSRSPTHSVSPTDLMSVAERRAFLAAIVRTPVGQVQEGSPLAEEMKMDAKGSISVKMPCKLRAIELDAKLAGELTPEREKDKALERERERLKAEDSPLAGPLEQALRLIWDLTHGG